SHPHWSDRRFTPSGDHDIRVTALNDLERISDRMTSGRTGRARCRVGAPRSEPDRHLARSQIYDAGGNEKRGDPLWTFPEQHFVFAFDNGESADSRSDDDSDSFTLRFVNVKSCVLQCKACRRERKMDEGIHFLDLFLLDKESRIKSLHFARDRSWK